ncbi:MAG: hypothetical protein ACYDAP_02530 [Thermoplasmataceae archaeon]
MNNFVLKPKTALDLYFQGGEDEKRAKLKEFCESLLSKDFLKVKNDCEKKDELDVFSRILCEKSVKKEGDRKKVLDTLIFVNNLEKYDNDIVRYSKVMIEEGRIAELSRELQEIHSLGQK